MGNGNILGQTNVPYEAATYTGLDTNTALVVVNNKTNNRTISVNVINCATDVVATQDQSDISLLLKDATGKTISTCDFTLGSALPSIKFKSETTSYTDASLKDLFRNDVVTLDNPLYFVTKVNNEFNEVYLATKNYVDSIGESKQETLVSGQNIKTLNSHDILGNGDLDIVQANPTDLSSGPLGKIKIYGQTYNIGGGVGDVQVNGITVVNAQNAANILTESTYNETTNKIATMLDVTNAINTAIGDIENLLIEFDSGNGIGEE